MNDIMIDTETLSTSPRAAVMSLGYAVFNEKEILSTGGWVINVASSILAGGEVCSDTIAWWKQREPDAVNAVTHGGLHIDSVMSQLRDVCVMRDVQKVWAHGATFDIPIVEFYMKEPPWRYSDHRDTRTLFDVAERRGWEKPKMVDGVAHNAVDDAVFQAECVISALNF